MFHTQFLTICFTVYQTFSVVVRDSGSCVDYDSCAVLTNSIHPLNKY